MIFCVKFLTASKPYLLLAGPAQKRVVVIQPISNGRFTIIPQEPQRTGNVFRSFIYELQNEIRKLLNLSKSYLFYHILKYTSQPQLVFEIFLYRPSSERIHFYFLENLGCSSWSLLAESHSALQPWGPTDTGSSEMCLPYIADGCLLDDRGSPTTHHFYDTNGREHFYWLAKNWA